MNFDSDFLNEQLDAGNIALMPNGISKEMFKSVHGLKPNSIIIEVFPIANLENIKYSRKLKDKITYRLKKEGFEFTSIGGQSGHYVKQK